MFSNREDTVGSVPLASCGPQVYGVGHPPPRAGPRPDAGLGVKLFPARETRGAGPLADFRPRAGPSGRVGSGRAGPGRVGPGPGRIVPAAADRPGGRWEVRSLWPPRPSVFVSRRPPAAP